MEFIAAFMTIWSLKLRIEPRKARVQPRMVIF